MWPVFYNHISFCKLLIKSMHSCKSYWVEPNINTPTKTKSKKGYNPAKIMPMITNIKLPVFYSDISLCKLSIKSMHPCKSYWTEPNIDTPTKTKPKKGHNSAKIWGMSTNIELDLYQWNQQQNPSRKRAITQPKFGGISPIWNLTCIL